MAPFVIIGERAAEILRAKQRMDHLVYQYLDGVRWESRESLFRFHFLYQVQVYPQNISRCVAALYFRPAVIVDGNYPVIWRDPVEHIRLARFNNRRYLRTS